MTLKSGSEFGAAGCSTKPHFKMPPCPAEIDELRHRNVSILPRGKFKSSRICESIQIADSDLIGQVKSNMCCAVTGFVWGLVVSPEKLDTTQRRPSAMFEFST